MAAARLSNDARWVGCRTRKYRHALTLENGGPEKIVLVSLSVVVVPCVLGHAPHREGHMKECLDAPSRYVIPGGAVWP